MALLTLGELELEGFEVPASVAFGGAQRAVVHNLLGGGRVIDTMGRDDRAVTWSGVLSGAGASDRALTFDAMRAAGGVLPLSWDVFVYDVIIVELDLDYCNPWWIPYRIVCTVLADLAQSADIVEPPVGLSVIGDLEAALAFVDVSSVLAVASGSGALAVGGIGVAATLAGLGAVQQGISVGIASAQTGLNATDVPSLVVASGSLAQLCTAQGYVARATNNVEGIAV